LFEKKIADTTHPITHKRGERAAWARKRGQWTDTGKGKGKKTLMIGKGKEGRSKGENYITSKKL